jgi:tripartite-type tricarboxylate transporter receptor subunit TctC
MGMITTLALWLAPGTGRSSMSAVRTVALLTSALIAVGSISSDARSESAQDFYRNKQVRLIVGHPVGNDHDVGGRLLAKYLGKHIPGRPNVIVQNMTAAASVAAANYVYGQAPRDGTVMGTFSRNFPSQAMMGQANVEADPRRFQWLGATSFPGRVCTAWTTATVKAPIDLFTSELIVGGSGTASTLSIVPTVLNHVLGTKFRIIEGYKAAQDVLLAMERGEVQGVCSSYSQFRSYDRLFRESKLRILFRVEEAALPDRPDVPTIFDQAKTDEQRQLMRFVFSSVEFGRPYVFPPDVPKERVEIMRAAIAAAASDPELIAEAEKMKLDMAYRAPEHLETLIANLYRTSPAIVAAVKKLVPNLD